MRKLVSSFTDCTKLLDMGYNTLGLLQKVAFCGNPRYYLRKGGVLMRKHMLCIIITFVLSLPALCMILNAEARAEDNYSAEWNPVKTHSPRNTIAFTCMNFDSQGEEQYVRYTFSYNYDLLQPALSQDEIDKVIDLYFYRFKQLFESKTYDEYEDADTVIEIFRAMKMYLNETEAETGVRLYFYLDTILSESEGDRGYSAYYSTDFWDLYVEMNIDEVYPEDFDLDAIRESSRPMDIKIKGFKNENGLYQYSSMKWKSSQSDISEVLTVSMNTPNTLGDGVVQHAIDSLFRYEMYPTRTILRFLDDELYEISFVIFAKDLKDNLLFEDIEANVLFSHLLEGLSIEYGDADNLIPADFQYIESFDVTFTRTIYEWLSSSDGISTSLKLSMLAIDGIEDMISISVTYSES